ncbi:glycosyltransferase [Acetobacter conturbans]|uniref:glycosyltransferase n=1 Tax=Acetobacter conturbans TaxID=1737472 RepID=UPI001F54BB25|nr:glycosyltransferase [Acetobacter conturbans]
MATVCTDDTIRRADQITQILNLSGWCGLDASGAIRIGESVRKMLPKATSRGRRKTVKGDRLSIRVNGKEQAFRWDGDHLLQPEGPQTLWQMARVEVLLDDESLPGSPLLPSTAMRTEGLVRSSDDGLDGWVWHPANPDCAPTLRILDAGDARELLAFTAESPSEEVSAHIPLARFRRISVPWSALPDGPVRVVDNAGKDLTGSPLDPGLERRAARWALEQARQISLGGRFKPSVAPPFLPVAVTVPPAAPPAASGHTDVPVLIVVPVYRDVSRTRACLESVVASLPDMTRDSPRLLIVNDASPEPEMAALLRSIAKDPRVTVKTSPTNRGFVVSANIGLVAALSGAARVRDVVLLNSDTLVAGAWLDELRTVAHSAHDIGTVTPLSNDATIFSYPALTGNPVPSLARTAAMMKLARTANEGTAIDVPTGHGFCLYIRHDCLTQTGLLRAELFAQGYGEENDFCLRARLAGWRNVAAPGAYVAHVGSVSFGATRDGLLRRNLALLNRLHPGYDALIADHMKADPLFEARRRLDILRWRQNARRHARRSENDVVLMVTHDYGGGVERVVRRRARELADAGTRTVLIRPVQGGCRLDEWSDEEDTHKDAGETTFPNLRFSLPQEWSRLLRLLTADPVDHIEWHHASGHHMAMRELASVLDVPYDVYVHDYIWFCPRISLMGVAGRYCGEPDEAGCENCLTTLGRKVDDDTPIADYVARSAVELGDARTVIVPSGDTATRMRRHFPALAPVVEPLEEDRPDLPLDRFCAFSSEGAFRQQPVTGLPRVPGRFRICVVGAIGKEKGYDILLAAAREAREQDRPLEFVIIGHTPDDAALMETGRVHVTGFYKEEEAVALVRAQKADYALIPSVWPETWCFTLGVAWRAGLNVAAFDLGAVADRIRTTGRGHIVPPGVSADRLNVILTSLCQQ